MEYTEYFVGIKFDGSGKSYYFSTDMDDLKIGDLVVVETVAGLEMGKVSTRLMDQSLYKSDLDLKPILRRPNQNDLDDYTFNQIESKKAMRIAQREIENLGLGMNLLEANYTLDGTKVMITYTAEERVDFRELLKVLAAHLHCRIELRQIVARDKAKIVGGIGTCGLPLCCSTFLNSFESVSITRAKNQMLSLNIAKLSGACGKLMCCLLYEDDMYTEAKKAFPKLGTIVKDEDEEYTVTGINILSKQVKLANQENVRFLPLDEVNDLLRGIKRKKVQIQEEEKVDNSLRAEAVDHNEQQQQNDKNKRNNNNQNKNNNRPNNNNRQNNQNRNHGNHKNHYHGNRNNRRQNDTKNNGGN